MTEIDVDKCVVYTNGTITYYIVVDDYKDGVYVDFKVYETYATKEEVDYALEFGFSNHPAELKFGINMSYKHIFPYYGHEKESGSKYHIQLHGFEYLQQWHDSIYDVCELMRDKYNIKQF